MNYKEEAYLMHFGVLGMKWGKRKGPSTREQGKSQRYIDRKKSLHGVKAQQNELEYNKKNYIGLKKITPDQYADLVGYHDRDANKEAYAYDLERYKRGYKSGKIFIEKAKVLEQKLSAIDTSSIKYKEVKKQVRSMVNDMINEVIVEELNGG